MVNRARLVERIAIPPREENRRNYLLKRWIWPCRYVCRDWSNDVSASVVLNNLYKLTLITIKLRIQYVWWLWIKKQSIELKEILRHYLDHQEEVVVVAYFDKKKAEDRAHILEGLQIALYRCDCGHLKKFSSGDIAKRPLHEWIRV